MRGSFWGQLSFKNRLRIMSLRRHYGQRRRPGGSGYPCMRTYEALKLESRLRACTSVELLARYSDGTELGRQRSLELTISSDPPPYYMEPDCAGGEMK